MKRFILAILFLMSSVHHVNAQILQGVFGTHSVAQTSVLKDSSTTESASVTVAGTSGRLYMGSVWSTGSAYTLTSLKIKLHKSLSPTGNITLYIYSDSGATYPDNVPLSLVATSTNTVDSSTLSDTPGVLVEFTFSGVALSTATKYWMVLYKATYDNNNHFSFRRGAVSNYLVCKSGDGSTWSSNNTDSMAVFESWGY
jgi:hypothetical protein